MKRGDKYLYLGLLLVFVVLPLLFGFFARARASRGSLVLEIVSDGRVIAREALAGRGAREEMQLHAGGGRNTLLIENGSVRMISADCPGGDCLRMPALTDERGSIVCLPHRLILRLRSEGGERGGDGLDAIAH